MFITKHHPSVQKHAHEEGTTLSTPDSDLMKVDEAAAFIGVSRPTMYRLAYENPKILKNYKRGRWRVFEAAGVRRFAELRKERTQL
jgi:predicted DNA-binding transcriptional regulator AlpA